MASVNFDPNVGGDGTTVTDDADPTTGLAQGGHRARFVAALAQIVAIAQFVLTKASAAAASAVAALSSENQALNHRNFATDEANRARDERVATEDIKDATGDLADQAAASAAIAASYTENTAVRMTANMITEDIAIGAGFNAVSAGPVGIADGVTVTVLPNHSWSIV